jgi:hypothetical protein
MEGDLLARQLRRVPPSIAAALRRIGLIADVPNTWPLYEPLFVTQRETYPNVAVARDVSYDNDPLNTFDIFAPQPALE